MIFKGPLQLKRFCDSTVSRSWLHSTGKMWSCWNGSKGWFENYQRAGAIPSGESLGALELFQSGEEEVPGRAQCVLPVFEVCI